LSCIVQIPEKLLPSIWGLRCRSYARNQEIYRYEESIWTTGHCGDLYLIVFDYPDPLCLLFTGFHGDFVWDRVKHDLSHHLCAMMHRVLVSPNFVYTWGCSIVLCHSGAFKELRKFKLSAPGMRWPHGLFITIMTALSQGEYWKKRVCQERPSGFEKAQAVLMIRDFPGIFTRSQRGFRSISEDLWLQLA
jgi:hypothetical protein